MVWQEVNAERPARLPQRAVCMPHDVDLGNHPKTLLSAILRRSAGHRYTRRDDVR